MTDQLRQRLTSDRFPLAQLPTPIEEMARLADHLGGPRLLVKRDDQTGLAIGGNKTRKLEYLVADAISQGADTLVTIGAVQSNHCRQTAAAAARAGLACELVLNGEPTNPIQGNGLLDALLGAGLHFCERSERQQVAGDLVENLRAAGKKPYLIGIGGSNGLGAIGYVQAMFELADQLREQSLAADAIVVATSSGGTQAGMVLGAKLTGFRGNIIGVGVGASPGGEPTFEQEMADIANESAALLGVDERVPADDFDVRYDYAAPGYGVVGAAEREAVELIARFEGLLVGPVYSCKAVMALADLISRGEFTADQTVLLWHTGDTPALFAHAGVLT